MALAIFVFVNANPEPDVATRIVKVEPTCVIVSVSFEMPQIAVPSVISQVQEPKVEVRVNTKSAFQLVQLPQEPFVIPVNVTL